jgi:hypothetical protein
LKKRIRRALWVLLSPAMHLLLRLFDNDDPWEVVERRMPPKEFGSGSTREFDWYMEGDTAVPVTSIDEICDWLLECEYADDLELFNERDFWQHPRTFEYLRRGDCEDHALWAWRKLTELNIKAALVSGKQRTEEGLGGHAWVVFEKDGREWLFETVAKDREYMIRLLDEVRHEYHPEASVDGSFETQGYVGYLHAMKRRIERERAERQKSRGRVLSRLLGKGRATKA